LTCNGFDTPDIPHIACRQAKKQPLKTHKLTEKEAREKELQREFEEFKKSKLSGTGSYGKASGSGLGR
jgi:hypothetical protein